jgi:type IV secretory pathway VirB6-like protein
VPLEAIFQNTATDLDVALIDGMNAAISAGLVWAAPQLKTGLTLYVVGFSLLMAYGRVDKGTFLTAIIRALSVAAILKAANYNYYVRDLFFTDLPNAIASAANGPAMTVKSAEQFDRMWSAVLHYSAFINGQASGWDDAVNRGIVWLLAGANLVALGVCFGMWYLARGFMAIIIGIGPWLIILYLWDATRGWVNEWIGKLVGFIVLQLAAATLLRIVLSILNRRLLAMNEAPGMSVDEMIANAAGLTGIFWIMAMVMFVLPSFVAIGSAAGTGVAMASGMVGSIGGTLAGGAFKAGGMAGKAAVAGAQALGKATGSAPSAARNRINAARAAQGY